MSVSDSQSFSQLCSRVLIPRVEDSSEFLAWLRLRTRIKACAAALEPVILSADRALIISTAPRWRSKQACSAAEGSAAASGGEAGK